MQYKRLKNFHGLSVSLGLAVLSGLVVAGCTVGPDYHAPATTMPDGWSAPASSAAPSTQPNIITTAPADLDQWWRGFNDPMLDVLVQSAVENNLDLKQAESRIRQARAQRGVVSAGLWPSVNADGSYRRTGDFKANSSGLFQVGLDAAWELDIFGGVRRSIESADANIQFAIEDQRDVLVSLISELAINYIDLRGLQRELVIARQNLATQKQTARLTQDMFDNGMVGQLDVANALMQVANTQSQLPVLESSISQAIHNISVLLARWPEALTAQLEAPQPIPVVPPVVPIGLPSDLLRRRPDIRRAEAQIHVATANIGVATADLFPKFSLTGSAGFASNRLSSLLNADSGFWSIGPGVTWNIFSSGQVQSNIEVTKALQEQSMLAYQKTVLTAMQEVDNALVAYAKEQEHRALLENTVDASQKAVDVATQLYKEGQTSFLDVLTAQRSLYASQDALVQSERTISIDLVSLYKALGGGWEQSVDATTAPTTRPSE